MKPEIYRGLLCWSNNRYDDNLLALVEEDNSKCVVLVKELHHLSTQIVTLHYYISAARLSLEELQKNFILTLYGGKAEVNYEVHYSEPTGYLWTDEDLKVGGHDLISELSSHVGKFIHMEVSMGLTKGRKRSRIQI